MTVSNFIKKQTGASAVEFAIVLPLFIVLTFGIIEFGIIMYNKAVITNASREGARFGILFDEPVHNDTQIKARVDTFLNNGSTLISLGNPSSHVTTASPPLPRPSGSSLSVTVTYPYDFLLIPSFIPGIPKTLSLNATTTMRME